MKSAYELAMERLAKKEPASKPLSDEKKKQLADIDSLYKSKIAEKELLLKPKIQEARFKGDLGAAEELEKELREETVRLNARMESEKESIRGKS
jgi:hypothetical protein